MMMNVLLMNSDSGYTEDVTVFIHFCGPQRGLPAPSDAYAEYES